MDPDNAAVVFMSRATRVVATSCSVVEAVLGTAVLAITWHQPCDRELRLWVLVLIIRLVLRAALQRYIATQQENSEHEEEIGEWNKAQKAKECLDVFGLIWFTIGNAWVFSSQTCATTAPMLYYTSLAIIVVTYVLMLFPIILAFAVLPCLCLCFPCVANYLWGEDQDGRALRLRRFDLDWSLIPTREYKSEDESLQRDCAICLNDFADGDTVRVLQCSGHHCFHRDCIDPWLATKAVCPCCREYAARPKPSVRRGRQNRSRQRRVPSEEETKDATPDADLGNRPAVVGASGQGAGTGADQLSEGPSDRSDTRTDARLLPEAPGSRMGSLSRRVSSWWRSGSESIDSMDDTATLPRNDSFGRVEEGRPRATESLPTPPAPRANARVVDIDSDARLPPLEHRSFPG